jgi:hypothetical protein
MAAGTADLDMLVETQAGSGALFNREASVALRVSNGSRRMSSLSSRSGPLAVDDAGANGQAGRIVGVRRSAKLPLPKRRHGDFIVL